MAQAELKDSKNNKQGKHSAKEIATANAEDSNLPVSDLSSVQKKISGPVNEQKQWRATPSPNAGEVKVEETHKASSKNGRVTIYGQIHNRPETSQDQLQSIGDRQAQLLAQLIHDKPDHLFVEGYSLTKQQSKQVTEFMRSYVQKMFPDGFDPSNLSARQRVFLAKENAVMVYAALNPEVQLHAVISKEAEEKVLQGREGKAFNSPESRALVDDFREKEAMNRVQKFLNEHPGANVALTFGRDHKWGPEDFPDKEKMPSITRVDWPKYRDSFTVGFELLRAKNSPEAQANLVNEISALDHRMLFTIVSEDLRLVAFDKLRVDPRHYKDANEMRDIMVKYAEMDGHTKLVEKINQAFENDAGPFKDFLPDKAVVDKFLKIEDGDIDTQSQEIINETNVATQNELVKCATCVTIEAYAAIYDSRAKIEALGMLDTSSYEYILEKGYNPQKLKAELYRRIKSAIPDPRDIIREATTPTEFESLKELHQLIDEMHKQNTGPFEIFK